VTGGVYLSILQIVQYPAEILETTCNPVVLFDDSLHKLLDDMFETMYEANGVGLAAPQIGIAKQIAVIDITEDQTGKLELINPILTEIHGEQIGVEGCLSFPGVFGDVNRAMTIKGSAKDRYGETFSFEAEDFLARAIQHEIDHLNGILFTSKVLEYYEVEEQEGVE
jgi:peptide deformylase